MAAGVVLMVAAALSLQGCTGSAATSTAGTSSTAGSSAVWPQGSLSTARSAFASYVATSTAAARTGDRALALSVLAGAAADTTSAQFMIAKAARIQPPYAQYTYGGPTFYLMAPSSAGSPQYFMVSVQRTLVPGTSPMTPSSQDVAAGVQLPSSGRVLMLFQKSASGSSWHLASASQLAPGESVPALATDRHGYVITESFSSPSDATLVRPALTAPLQATVVDDGPASAAAQFVASGPLTTGMYQAAATSARGITPPAGDAYQWVLEGSSYGRLALQTADGGVLVLYAMYLNNTVETKSKLNQDIPVRPGPPITVPDYLKPLLAPSHWTPRTRLEAQDVLTFAAIDPPKADPAAKVRVIAIGGGTYTASSS